MLVSLMSGIGGASSAGLNATLPVLIFALADRSTSMIELNSPYDFISTQWGMILLLLLLPIELVADKIPQLDHASDLVHAFIRPAAAAFLAMAMTDERGHINPIVAGAIGLAVGFAVHRVKATARPIITRSTSGIGNPMISMVEDVVTGVTVIVAIFYPLALLVLLPVFGYGLYRTYARMMKGSKRLRRISGATV